MVKKLAKGDPAQAAFAFMDFARSVGQCAKVDPALVDHFAPYFNDPEFKTALKTVILFGARGMFAAPATKVEAELGRPEWQIHKNVKGKKTHWTSDFHGVSLRVERRRAPDGKVVFVGLVNGRELVEHKRPSAAQFNLETAALQQIRQSGDK